MKLFVWRFLAQPGLVRFPARVKPGSWLFTGVLGVLVILSTGCRTQVDVNATPPDVDVPAEGTLAIATSTLPNTSSAMDLPDLTIARLVIETPTSNPCLDFYGRMLLHVEVSNQGQEAAGEFVVQMNSAQQIVPAGLEPGATEDLVFSEVPGMARILVDMNDQVAESDEDNNFFANRLVQLPLPLQCLVRPTPTPITQGPLARLESVTSSGQQPKVLDLAFSPNGRVLATGSTDNALRLWQIQGGPTPSASLLRAMQGHPFPVLSIAYSPSGALLATGSSDHLVRLWRVADGALVATLSGHSDWVTQLAFSPDERYLASAGRDYTVRLWRTITERLQTTIDEGMADLTDLAFSPAGGALAWSESNATVRIFDLQRLRWLHIFPPTQAGLRPAAATSIAYTKDGSILYAGYADGHLSAWDTTSGELILEFPLYNGKITCLDISPNQRWLVFGTENGSLQLWYLNDPLAEPDRELVFQGHAASINEVAFSPTGELIASASDDGSVLLWLVPPEQLP